MFLSFDSRPLFVTGPNLSAQLYNTCPINLESLITNQSYKVKQPSSKLSFKYRLLTTFSSDFLSWKHKKLIINMNYIGWLVLVPYLTIRTSIYFPHQVECGQTPHTWNDIFLPCGLLPSPYSYCLSLHSIYDIGRMSFVVFSCFNMFGGCLPAEGI